MLCYSILQLFTFVDCLSFIMQLHVSNEVAQFAIASSHILILDSQDILSIHSICSTPNVLFKSTKFQHRFVKIYSVALSFFIIDGHTRQLFRIDAKLPHEIHSVAYLKFECRSLLSAVTSEYRTLFILSDDHTMLAIWNSNENTIKYLQIQLNQNVKVEKIYALPTALVFHDYNHKVHLQRIDNTTKVVNLECADILTTKSNRLALLDKTENTLVIYDVNLMLRGKIQLQTSCDALCFTEDENYLFVVSHKESMLLMYRVDNGKRVEKLFIENLSVLIQATTNRLILTRNNKLLLISIAEKGSSSLKR